MASETLFYNSLLNTLYDGVYFVDKDRRITYWNKGAEEITGYSASEVVGKKCSEGILMHTDQEGDILCNSCCPLNETICKNNGQEREMFLQHKQGHRVPVKVRVTSVLDEHGAVVGGLEVFSVSAYGSAAVERVAELEKMAFVDPLTGLPNRRFSEIALNARLEELQRYDWGFGVIFIDIDHFKIVNDQYGHDIGDEVLKMAAKTLQNTVRSFDVVSRWGGEEYVAIIVHVSSEELVATANRCRALVERSRLPGAQPVSVTISAGATLAKGDDTVHSLIKRADELMYKSKIAGRNCVSVG